MHPIKFLKPEIAEIIEEITSRFSDMNPIDKLIHLKNSLTQNQIVFIQIMNTIMFLVLHQKLSKTSSKTILNNYFFTLPHITHNINHTQRL